VVCGQVFSARPLLGIQELLPRWLGRLGRRLLRWRCGRRALLPKPHRWCPFEVVAEPDCLSRPLGWQGSAALTAASARNQTEHDSRVALLLCAGAHRVSSSGGSAMQSVWPWCRRCAPLRTERPRPGPRSARSQAPSPRAPARANSSRARTIASGWPAGRGVLRSTGGMSTQTTEPPMWRITGRPSGSTASRSK
jgi:hypothetical protein